MGMSTLIKKKIFVFSIIIWKYFLSNINLIFEYSVLDTRTFNMNYQLTAEAKISF